MKPNLDLLDFSKGLKVAKLTSSKKDETNQTDASTSEHIHSSDLCICRETSSFFCNPWKTTNRKRKSFEWPNQRRATPIYRDVGQLRDGLLPKPKQQDYYRDSLRTLKIKSFSPQIYRQRVRRATAQSAVQALITGMSKANPCRASLSAASQAWRQTLPHMFWNHRRE